MPREVATAPPALCVKFHRASELIGRRWTGAIIYVLLRVRCRFGTLREAIPDITDRMPIDETSRKFAPKLKSLGYDVTYREYDGRHSPQPEIVREAFEWFVG